ncbi:hypothetical protein MUK42_00920 [Musa troglodytarum]|uniref:Uncharacterized protein n=1 Tax=Musa troglodytarum TaxID=320322 RepID=A0A9E7FEI7_9LILI|nr:hypothetical protein MUK42_00920 [Musa troglodytarum]
MAAIKYRGSKAVTNFDVGPYTQNPSFPQSQPCPAPPLEMFPELTQLQPQPQPQPPPSLILLTSSPHTTSFPAKLLIRSLRSLTSTAHPASPSTSPMAMTSPNCSFDVATSHMDVESKLFDSDFWQSFDSFLEEMEGNDALLSVGGADEIYDFDS